MNEHDFTFAQSDSAPLPDRQVERRTVTIRVDELERALTRAVRLGISEAMRNATSDENVKKFWRRGFEELSTHGSAKVREGVGGAVIKWGVMILASAALSLWLLFGVKK